MSRIYTIAPKIEIYNDREFDSKLNASWAKFFDARGIKWIFERQGFNLPCRPWQDYWPDFFFPDLVAWAEVKPDCTEVEDGFTPMEYSLCAELCIRTGQTVIMLIGAPDEGPHPAFYFRDGDAFIDDWRFV